MKFEDLKIAETLSINCPLGLFESISNNVDLMTEQITILMDNKKVEYELANIQGAVVESLAIALLKERRIKIK